MPDIKPRSEADNSCGEPAMRGGQLGLRAQAGERRAHLVRSDRREVPLDGQGLPEAVEQCVDRIDHGLEFGRRVRGIQLREVERMALPKLGGVAVDGVKGTVEEPPGAHEDQQERDRQEGEEVSGDDADRGLPIAHALGDLDDHAAVAGGLGIGPDILAIHLALPKPRSAIGRIGPLEGALWL